MKINNISTAFTTNDVARSRDFYVKYLNAKVSFDCGWYVSLEFEKSNSSLQFMSPQEPHHKLSQGNGITYNFNVDDVALTYEHLTQAGLEIVVPLEHHPWGDKGFGIQDPNGITIYLYEEIEPSDEFRQYYM